MTLGSFPVMMAEGVAEVVVATQVAVEAAEETNVVIHATYHPDLQPIRLLQHLIHA